jgi:hypothetical protein
LESDTPGASLGEAPSFGASQANTVRKPFSICGGTEQCLLVETHRHAQTFPGVHNSIGYRRAGWDSNGESGES